MGNCLEPSESEVQKARMAKRRKMAALAAADDPNGGVPPTMAYPYHMPPMVPYNDPRLTGIYVSQPPPQPQPQAYAVMDTRTGQAFLVHDPGPMRTSGVPVGMVPYMVDERMMYENNNNNQHKDRKSSSGVVKSSDEDAADGKRKSRDGGGGGGGGGSGHTSKRNSAAVSVEGRIKTSTMNSKPAGLQTNAPFEVVEKDDIDTNNTNNNNNHQKTHNQNQNGHVSGMGLFSQTGVMEMEAETLEPIIIDFLDPIPPTISTRADTHASFSYVEYETSKDNDEDGTKDVLLNGHVTFDDDLESEIPEPPVLGNSGSFESELPEPPVLDNSGSSRNELGFSARSQESSSRGVIVYGSSTKSEQHEMVNGVNDSPVDLNHHFSTSTQSAGEIDVFPPKNFEAEPENREIPEILKSTLSQTVSTDLPSDAVDVVITYSVLGEYELDIVRRLTRQLGLVGLSVWAERLGDSSRARKSDKTAQAILGAKVLIVMLSEGSSGQRFIRDHVAIATMTNISIFPVASEPPTDVNDAMPKELKVQLTPYAWTELTGGNEDSFLFQLRSLARSVQDEVEERITATTNGVVHRGNIQRQKSLTNQGMAASASNFWDVHFGHRESVKWERLEQTLQDTFKMVIKDSIPEPLQPILFASIRNRISNATNNVNRADFMGMCQSSKTQDMDVWEAIVQVAGMVQAVRDVFEVESTVRHLAVEYTEHFSNPSVLSALRDLLSDPDPNFRSLAVVSLARCTATRFDPESLECVERTLEDPDRLVREAGCLALGHLRAESAVKKLIHVWRNDVISQVREAAKMSLDQIGGEEVTDAMRVTDVLANEIRELTNET